MITTDDARNLTDGGGNVVEADGTKIGKIAQVFVDDQTGQPQWVTVTTGLFGTSESFVPLDQATLQGSDLQVPVSKDQVKDAPRVDADGHLEPQDEDALYQYYGLGGTAGAGGHDGDRTDDLRGDRDTDRGGDLLGSDYRDVDDHGVLDRDVDDVGDTATRARGADAGQVGHDTSGPDTDEAMTRSEEQLHVGTEQVESGRARLRKYVVTEEVSTTVPVSHEEVRVEREPITDANRGDAVAGGDITEEEHEVTLHEERPVVDKETVPVERVRMDTRTVTEDAQVDETLRKEQIDADGDSTDGRTTDGPADGGADRR